MHASQAPNVLSQHRLPELFIDHACLLQGQLLPFIVLERRNYQSTISQMSNLVIKKQAKMVKTDDSITPNPSQTLSLTVVDIKTF